MTTVRLEFDLPASVKLLSSDQSQERRGDIRASGPPNPTDLIDAGSDSGSRGPIGSPAAELAPPSSGEAIDAGSAPVDLEPLLESTTPSSIPTSPMGIDAGPGLDLQPPLPPGAGPQPPGTEAPPTSEGNGKGPRPPPDSIARTIQ